MTWASGGADNATTREPQSNHPAPSTQQPLPRIGFVGLGRMGLPMARNLLAAGYELIVFSRSRAPIDALVAEGATAAQDLAAVAEGADIVLSALPTVDACREVYLAANGLVGSARAGSLLIDISTVPPELSMEVAVTADARGVAFLDAPVSGGPEAAQAGTLTIMAGGRADAFQRALPVLQVLGSNVFHVGANGAGSAVKLVNQLLTAVNGVAVAEALALGRAYALPFDVLHDVITTSFGDSRMFRRLLPMIAANDFSGGAAIELYVKDIGIVTAMGQSVGYDLPVTEAALGELRAAQAAGLGRNDISAMVSRVEGSG